MAAAIVTQRDVKPEYQQEALELLKQLRAVALRQPGYLYGETLFSATQAGRHLIVSRWRGLREWKEWEDKPERLAIVSAIEKLLAGPPRIEVYLDSPLWEPEQMP